MLVSFRSLRSSLMIAACALSVTMMSPRLRADDTAVPGDTSAQATAADKSADAPGMPGCGVNGSCCGTCQEKAAEAKPAEQAAAGCPCQRAKKAPQGS